LRSFIARNEAERLGILLYSSAHAKKNKQLTHFDRKIRLNILLEYESNIDFHNNLKTKSKVCHFVHHVFSIYKQFFF